MHRRQQVYREDSSFNVMETESGVNMRGRASETATPYSIRPEGQGNEEMLHGAGALSNVRPSACKVALNRQLFLRFLIIIDGHPVPMSSDSALSAFSSSSLSAVTQ